MNLTFLSTIGSSNKLYLLALQVRAPVWPFNLTQFFLRCHNIEIEANCLN